jgi:formamidopyrimidine-DNA glycosylase
VPELPDVTVYIEHLEARLVGERLKAVRVASPFLVRTFDPPLRSVEGKRVVSVRRMGKRIVIGLEDELFIVVHLMIAGRFRWKDGVAKPPGKIGLAAFEFPNGTLLLTEASSKKRASLHVVRGESDLAKLDPGGLEVLDSTLSDFRASLVRENHTLKRALTDPRLFSGIGNAYSDEILHRAKLSPVRRTQQLDESEIARLHDATRSTLEEWIERLRAESKSKFPENVTAFRDEMAVHGKYRKPCPVCGSPVQRIVYAENEANYCPTCQTGGKLLADRGLSRLLGDDWPRSLADLEAHIAERKKPKS